jgi:D-alanine-D-alanine ligase
VKRLRVLVLLHKDLVPPEDAARVAGMSDDELFKAPWKTEFDVSHTLREMGHEVRLLGVISDLGRIHEAIEEQKPHVAFNLLEEFDGVAVYDAHVVSYLELLRQPYTGCNPRGLTLARDKALSKKLLAYHRIRVPEFSVFAKGRRVRRPRRLAFPLLVKSVTEEGSLGISQASLVHDDKKLAERVEFIHQQIGTDAIAEQFIEGRELYVGLLGNVRVQTLPVWELHWRNVPEGEPRIATGKVKWDTAYQKRWGIETSEATDLGGVETRRIRSICRRVWRILGLSGYARMDLRMRADGEVFVIEANPNPQLGYGEDFAESAEAAHVSYDALLQRILDLGMRYRAPWKG